MPSISYEFKEALCVAISNFQRRYKLMPESTQNQVQIILDIIAHHNYAPKLRREVAIFIVQLPTKWYGFLPGVEDSCQDLKTILQRILDERRFRIQALINRVSEETHAEALSLRKRLEDLQLENTRLKESPESLELIKASYQQGVEDGFKDAKKMFQECLQQLDIENKYARKQITELVASNQELENKLEEEKSKSDMLVTQNQQLIAENHELLKQIAELKQEPSHNVGKLVLIK